MKQVPSQGASTPVGSWQFSPHILQLAQSYHLGTPQRKLTSSVGWLFLLVATGVFLAVGLCNLVNVAAYAGTPSLMDNGTVVTRSALDIIVQNWQGSAFFLSLGVIALCIGLWGRRYITYECSEGFFEMAGSHVKNVMYWKTIQRTWTVTTRNYSSNGGNTSIVRYFLLGPQGETVETDHKYIWQRANYEVTYREFSLVSSKMLADYYAGRPVAFGSIFVDLQGVHLPGGAAFNQNGWLLPLQAIQKVRVRTALTLEMDPASRFPTIHSVLPHNAGVFLLFLREISHGRILTEYRDWPLY